MKLFGCLEFPNLEGILPVAIRRDGAVRKDATQFGGWIHSQWGGMERSPKFIPLSRALGRSSIGSCVQKPMLPPR